MKRVHTFNINVLQKLKDETYKILTWSFEILIDGSNDEEADGNDLFFELKFIFKQWLECIKSKKTPIEEVNYNNFKTKSQDERAELAYQYLKRELDKRYRCQTLKLSVNISNPISRQRVNRLEKNKKIREPLNTLVNLTTGITIEEKGEFKSSSYEDIMKPTQMKSNFSNSYLDICGKQRFSFLRHKKLALDEITFSNKTWHAIIVDHAADRDAKWVTRLFSAGGRSRTSRALVKSGLVHFDGNRMVAEKSAKATEELTNAINAYNEIRAPRPC